ncbi:MAG: flagellar hook-length control protein FliK [Bacillota bacterium]
MDIRIAGLTEMAGPLESINQLRVGQLVRVEVLKITGQEALVKLNNMTLQAATTGTELPGSIFFAVVESMTTEQIRLKRMNPASINSDYNEVPLEELAAKVGVNNHTDAPAVIREMLRWQLPLLTEKLTGLLKEIKEAPPEDRDALIGLMVWLETLDPGELKENSRAVLALLMGKSASSEDLIAGEKTINRSTTVYPGQENLYCISLQRQGINGEVYFTSREPKSLGVNPRQVMIVVRLHTEHLGEIWVQARVEGTSVSLLVASDNDHASSFLKQHLEPFQDIIREAGFNLAALKVTKRKIGTVIELMGGNPPLAYTTMDIKV